jgi:hypothetical protein
MYRCFVRGCRWIVEGWLQLDDSFAVPVCPVHACEQVRQLILKMQEPADFRSHECLAVLPVGPLRDVTFHPPLSDARRCVDDPFLQSIDVTKHRLVHPSFDPLRRDWTP